MKGIWRRLADSWKGVPLTGQLFIAMFFPMWLVLSIYFLNDIRANMRHLMETENAVLNSLFPILNSVIEESMLHGSHEHIKHTFSPQRQSVMGESLQLLDAKGRAVDTSGLGTGRPLRRGEPREFSPSLHTVIDLPIKAQASCRSCHAPARDPIGYVRITMPRADILSTASAHFRRHAAIFCLSMTVMLLWALGIVRWLIQAPLERVGRAMARVAAGKFETIPEDGPKGEMRAIASGFNAMVRQLDKDRCEITELHQRQVAHLDRLATLGELAANLAHEVRNPLTGISSTLQILGREAPQDGPRRELLSKILAQINRMDQTMANFLQYARMPAAAVRPFNLREPLDRILLLIGPRLRSQGVSLQKSLTDPLPLIVGDPGQIEQVFLNVCLNALQAMPKGGSLEISARPDGADRVLVGFSDTGEGIPPEHIDEVFQPFFTTNEKGSGLGLPISRQILMAQGGTIRLESTFGKGTTVLISLPAPRRGWA